MGLPIRLPERDRAGLSSRVAVRLGGHAVLEIQVGLVRGGIQNTDDPKHLSGGQQARRTLSDEDRGLPRDLPPGDGGNGQVPHVITHVPAQEARVSCGASKSSRVSENENNAVVNFWNSLSLEEQQAFRSIADKRVFAAGARLMQEGERANHVAVILEGWTEIRVRKNGGERVVTRRGPGQLIGERAALQISVRSATVVAIQPVDALVMRTEDFAAYVSDHPGVLDIVENQIFTRMKEEPADCDHAQPHAAPSTSVVPGQSGNRSYLDGARPHRPLLSGENCTVLHTDVVAFGAEERSEEDRDIIRQAISDMSRVTLGTAWDMCRCENRGDGHLIVVPPSIPTAQVMEWLRTVLPRELRRHNRIYSEWIRIQLRVAVDVGPITEDLKGVAGKSIIRAVRMLDSPAFKQAITDTRATLGIIASPFVYDIAIKYGRGSLDPAGFAEVPVHVKETRTTAWMQLIDATRATSPLWPQPSREQLVRASMSLRSQRDVLATA
jgi:hypothetical protein